MRKNLAPTIAPIPVLNLEPKTLAELKAELFQPKTTELKDNGNDVSWEAEVGHMMKNSIRHKTYLRLMSKIYQQMAQAMDTKS